MGKKVTEVGGGIRKVIAKAGNFFCQRKEKFGCVKTRQSPPKEEFKDKEEFKSLRIRHLSLVVRVESRGGRRVNSARVENNLVVWFAR